MGKYIETGDGVKLFVEDIGQGRPIVFLHGWPLNHKMFEYQFITLAEHGFRCIGIDQRGFGLSDAPWEGYSYDRLADDVREVIVQLGVRDAILVGFSIGGAIATRYMARHAGYGISKLVLAGPATPVFVEQPDYPHGSPVKNVTNLIVSAHLDRPKMVQDVGAMFFNKNGSTAFEAWFAALGVSASAQGTLQSLYSLRDEDLRSDLPQIAVPTAIFHGTEDKIAPYELAQLTGAAIPGSITVAFEESGHGLMFDEPSKFNEELLAFIRA